MGVWDVPGMLSQMDWGLFCEWVAYAAEEPFGEERADARAAQITAMLANVNRDPKKHPRAFTIEDFMFTKEGRRRPERKALTGAQEWSDFKRMMRLQAEAG